MIRKYPRTQHIEGSRLQPGDSDLSSVPFRVLRGANLVVEEKIDGANAAISFNSDGGLQLQSRGHYLTGGPRERHFALFKTWASTHSTSLHGVLGDRYVMYGEWVYARHTVFYDRLPHYFLEFDVLDLKEDVFLSTPRRRRLLANLPVVSVPVLHHGTVRSLAELTRFIGPSAFKSEQWEQTLRHAAETQGLDVARVVHETERSSLMEGLYVKHENDDVVLARYKWVRAEFLQTVLDSGSHWMERPILPNRLADGVDLYSPDLT